MAGVKELVAGEGTGEVMFKQGDTVFPKRAHDQLMGMVKPLPDKRAAFDGAGDIERQGDDRPGMPGQHGALALCPGFPRLGHVRNACLPGGFMPHVMTSFFVRAMVSECRALYKVRPWYYPVKKGVKASEL